MNPEGYRRNRASFPSAELSKYEGQWVAFSADGRRIIASHADLVSLNSLVAAAGADPEAVAFERIECDDVFLGAAELR